MNDQPNDMGIAGTSMELKADTYMYNTDYHRFADFVGVDEHRRKNSQVAEKLSFIYDWAREQVGRDDRETIMRALRDYQKGLGDNSAGETLLNRLYRDIRLGVDGQRMKSKPKAEAPKKSAPTDIQKTVAKKIEPVVKNIEKQVEKTVKEAVNQSISKALSNMFR